MGSQEPVERALPSSAARVEITDVSPCVARGRYAAKRCVGDELVVRAELVADGHDRVAGVLRVRAPADERGEWREVRLTPTGQDRFEARVTLDAIGTWELAIEAWVDALGSWLAALRKKAAARDVEPVDLAVGAALLEEAARDEATRAAAARLRDEARPLEARLEEALGGEFAARIDAVDHRPDPSTREPWPLRVDPKHARFAAWYELFPRSTGEGTRHGTFATATGWLDYIAKLGFDTVYLPPIHPIGRTLRKGPNNTLQAGPDDPGSPWAIGAEQGGHTAVHPDLGTLADFDAFVAAAGERGLRVALDIAFQASPDHPWVKAHRSWFLERPDGTIQYAENPPKKYQDVYPFDFASDDWPALWRALRDVLLFWIEHGVSVFRVDNPHTKPVAFWEWCIADVQRRHPEATFLAEAFTRPSLKYLLGRVGFTQGYTYFTWRNSAHEMRAYLEQLTQTEVAETFRPSFWPNTPDILPEHLQIGGRPAFLSRLVMAATLSSHYGLYGPAFELMAREPRPGSGEYIDNEKYEIKDWDLDDPASLAPWLRRVNEIRRAHPALSRNDTLVFHPTDNEQLLCYSKHDGDDGVLVVVSFDPHHRQAGWTQLDLDALGVDPSRPFQVHDLLGEGRYLWNGPRNYVELSPDVLPAQVFAVRRYVRTERDFDYYL